jgi:hypothetical protein
MLSAAASRYLEGAQLISAALRDGRARGRGIELRRQLSQIADCYVRTTVQLYGKTPGDQLYIWQAVWEVVGMEVYDVALIKLGMASLKSWWKAVESRSFEELRVRRGTQGKNGVDLKAANIARSENRNLARLSVRLRERRHEEVAASMVSLSKYLEKNISSYVDGRLF